VGHYCKICHRHERPDLLARLEETGLIHDAVPW
jgi:hypothetical protein